MSEPQPVPVTAGALLRAARERQGLHIAALAASIKVSPRKLEALENDRHEELPDATFVRALAQTVCRTLKVDARPVLDLLPPAPAVVALEPGRGGLGTPFHERPGRVVPGLALTGVRPLVWAGAALVLAALVLFLMPAGMWDAWLEPTPAMAPAASPAAPAPESAGAVPGATDLHSSAPALAGSEAQASGPGPGASAAAVPSTAVETVFAAPAALAGGGEGAAATGPLQLRSTEDSWVEVRDGANRLLLSRNLRPGEGVALDGALPLRLVIGNAAATEVAFRGRTLNLAASTRDNVARLELQ